MKIHNSHKGFTLIELLIVIGIIGFIAAAILVAVDPVKRIQDSRDTQRFSEVNGILNAILKNQVDNTALYNGAAAVAQVSTATLTGASGTFGVTINGTEITQAFSTSLSVTAALLDAAIDASGEGGAVTATNTGGAVITITSDAAGTAFTITDGGTTGGDAAVAIATTTTNVIAAAIDSDNTTSQVLVADATGIDCDTPASAPACPDDGASLTLPTTNGVTCVVNIIDLVPTYLASVPTDPLDGQTPTVGNLAIGTTNSGYYLNRNSGNRFTVGACYGEQDNDIKTSR